MAICQPDVHYLAQHSRVFICRLLCSATGAWNSDPWTSRRLPSMQDHCWLRHSLASDYGSVTLHMMGCSAVVQGSLLKTPGYGFIAMFLTPFQESCRLSSLQLEAQPPHYHGRSRCCPVC
jgi:hypothetical protein